MKPGNRGNEPGFVRVQRKEESTTANADSAFLTTLYNILCHISSALNSIGCFAFVVSESFK